MVQPLEHHLCFSCDNLSVPQKQLANDFLVQGVDRLTTQGSCLPAWWGRSPLGVPFGRAKGTKTRLGRSPLRTSLGYWPLFVPPHQATLGSWPYGRVVSTSGPTLEQRRSRRRTSGFR